MPNGTSTTSSDSSISSSLLRHVKDQDPLAWRRLTDIFCPQVFGWAQGAGLQSCDAADVMQETFRAVATNIASFDATVPDATFRGWLWTIARSKIRDHFRRQARQPEAAGGSQAYERLEQLAQPPDDSLSGGSIAPLSFATGPTLELVRAEVEDRTWQAFWRTVVGGERPADVAAALGLKIGAVYTAKSRVLRRLREELGGLIGPLPSSPPE